MQIQVKNKVSVVTVVFNAQDFIEETIKSIINQTCFDQIEYLVIDGASTDRTLEIINKYKDKIDILMSEPDDGVYSAMNKAIELATGKWINFMNAGDTFYDTKVVENFLLQAKSDSDLIYGDVNLVGQGLNKVVKSNLTESVFKETPFCHQSLFTRLNLMKKEKFDTTYKVVADYDFILNSYLLHKRFQYLDFVVSKYQLGGLSYQNMQLMNIEGVHILTKAKRKHPDINLENSPFFQNLKLSLGNDHHIRVSEELHKLTNISVRKNPFNKIVQYKRLIKTYSGGGSEENKEELTDFKVLHLNTFDKVGGAARAVFRLNEALRKLEFHSGLLTLYKYSNQPAIVSPFNPVFKRYILKIMQTLTRILFNIKELDPNKPFSINKIGILNQSHPIVKKAEIVHLHWINNHLLSIAELEKLANSKKPLVWTTHDMWAFTGGCHYPVDCNFKFAQGCGNCPVINSVKKHDISSKLLAKKTEIFEKANITVIAPSNYMKEKAQSSPVFKNKRIEVIPNALDCSFFYKVSVELSQNYFPFMKPGKKYIGFGADRNAGYKGLSYLIESINLYAAEFNSENLELVVFGMFEQEVLLEFPSNMKIHNIGLINDDEKLRALYSFIDIFISPSLMEAFGQVITEAMACETACVAFDGLGSKDIINHKENGYLAEYKSVNDIKNGIHYLLINEVRLKEMKANARKKVVETFDYPIIAQQHIDLYNSLTEAS